MVRCERSILRPDDVSRLVERSYRLRVTDCELTRSLTNDVYAVRTPAGQYALKIYQCGDRPGARSVDEIAWEQDLALAVAATGVTTARPIALESGEHIGVVDAPEGGRPYALTAWARGHKPQLPFSDGLYRQFGVVAAAFHRDAAAVSSSHGRRGFDLARDLDEPLAQVARRLDAADKGLVRELAARARTSITALADAGLTWGVQHGDVSLDNIHVRGEVAAPQVTLHDFDLAGPGWLVADLTGVHATEHWEAFLDGYTSVKPLRPADLAALPWFTVVGLIANLAFHLVDKVRLRGTESIHEGWVDRELTSLRAMSALRTIESRSRPFGGSD